MFKNLLILICMMALVDFVWIENSWSFCDPHCEYEKTKKKKEEAEKKEFDEKNKKAQEEGESSDAPPTEDDSE